MNDLTRLRDEVSAEECGAWASAVRIASKRLAVAHAAAKNDWLMRSAEALRERTREILNANAIDRDRAPALGLSAAAIDRLTLDVKRIESIARSLEQIAALPDPVGEVIRGEKRPNGLDVRQIRVPIGVVFIIYESRPNVTVDAAAICLKSGNGAILRGGKEAIESNCALMNILKAQFEPSGLPEDSVLLVPTADRAAVGHLLARGDLIDLAIPRGGESLIRRVVAEARMPVLKHFQGNCHVYVDREVEIDMAVRVTVNAKADRPGVCNAAETLLVHRAIAARFLPIAARALADRGVELRGDEPSRALVPSMKAAIASDWDTEYLDKILAVRVVESIDEAIAHIDRHGSKHTDAILTSDFAAARRFAAQVDSAAVVVNASTRFNDGGELGMGAEIGISTDKYHARGPCGLRELTTTKWIVEGDGHIRL